MPIYEYECAHCGHVTEAMRRMDDADQPMECEACGSKKTARKHSVFTASTGSPAPDMPAGPCGQCGGEPGSCAFR